MSTLLISMLGGALPGHDRPGHLEATYRLPGGRIVKTGRTCHLGVELASALQVQKLCFVGTSNAYFDRLVDLLSNEAAEAPVAEPAPSEAPADPAPVLSDEPGEDAAASELASEVPAEPAGSAGAPEPEADEKDPGAPQEDLPPAPASSPEDLPEPVTDSMELTGPLDPADESHEEDPPPEPITEELPVRRAPAQTLPHKAHEPDLRPLRARLEAQAATGRADRDALTALGERLASALGLCEVHCILISAPTDDRSFQASLRDLIRLPGKGDEVHLDVSHGDRTLPLLGTLALHYMSTLDENVKPGQIFQGAPEHADQEGVAPVLTLEAPLQILRWISAFDGLRHGQAPDDVRELINADRRLQGLAGPYVRYQRGVQFGALSEVVQGARMLEERRRRLNKLPYAHRYRLFDGIMREATEPFSANRPHSQLQLELATQAIRAGRFTFAALHLREAVLTYCLELFGQVPTRIWADVPQSGGAQEVRLRDVAGYILASHAAAERFGDLTLAWPLLNDARRQYGNIPGSTIHASMLKQACHDINRLHHIVQALISRDALRGLEETRTFEDVVKESIDSLAVRPREARRRTRGTHDGRQRTRSSTERRPRRTTRSSEGGRRREGPPRHRDGPRGRDQGSRRPGPERTPEPRREPGEDRTPRVEQAPGMGNLGLALRGAGLVPEGKKKRPEAPSAAPPEAPPPSTEEAASGIPTAAANASATGKQEAPEGTGQKAPATPAPAQEPSPEKVQQDDTARAAEGDDRVAFDVAGPSAPPASE